MIQPSKIPYSSSFSASQTPRMSVPRPPTSQQRSATNIARPPRCAPSATALYMTTVTSSRNAASTWRKSSQSYTGRASYTSAAEVLLEARVRHRGGVHPDHLDALDGRQPGHRAEHRHAVVALRVDGPAAQRRAVAAHDEAVGGRLDVGPEAAQPVHHARDPVRLLQPQLLRAAHDCLALRVRAQQAPRASARRSRAAPRRARPPCPRAVRTPRPARPPAPRRPPSRAPRARPRSPRPCARRSGRSRCASSSAPRPSTTTREPLTRIAAATMKAADEGSPGTTTSSSSSSSTWATVIRSPSRSNGTRARRSMRSVWSRLVEPSRDGRGAGREHPGDQHARLHLRARDRKVVLDAGELRPADGEGREAAVARLDARAHHARAARRPGPRAAGGSTRPRRASRRRPAAPRASPAAAA